MHQPTVLNSARYRSFCFIFLFAAVHSNSIRAGAGEISVDDFRFDGPNGSQGASIERVGENHFRVSLGHAPKQPTWCNMLYFQILRNAKGNSLRLDVEFKGGDAYRFNHNSATWSYDGEDWQAIRWCDPNERSKKGDSLLFPVFADDTVFFGAQVPLSFVDWLLSEQGDDARRRSICHFVPITSPDGPSNGWYRVNAQGVSSSPA
jgi:hypothetical protein